MKKEEILKLRRKGLSFQKIGNLFNISRQRIHQILNYKIQGGIDKLREKVRERDNFTCQICFKKWIHGRRLDVHHLDPKKEGKNAFIYKNNKDLDKMVTLCHKCHLNLGHIKAKMRKSAKIRFT